MAEQSNPFMFEDAYPDKDITDYNAEEAYEMGVSAGWDRGKADKQAYALEVLENARVTLLQGEPSFKFDGSPETVKRIWNTMIDQAIQKINQDLGREV
jgi:hypothetical protein